MKNKDINIIIVHKINKKIFVIDENIVNQQNTTTGKSKKKIFSKKNQSFTIEKLCLCEIQKDRRSKKIEIPKKIHATRKNTREAFTDSCSYPAFPACTAVGCSSKRKFCW